MLRFRIDRTINFGQLLTVLTLVVGFCGAGINTYVEHNRTVQEDSWDGSLRLILHILRDNDGPMSVDQLLGAFKSEEMKQQRVDYCGYDYHFGSKSSFECAVYQIENGGDLKFISPHVVAVCYDCNPEPSGGFHPTSTDAQQLLSVLDYGVKNGQLDVFDFQGVANACIQLAPDATQSLLRKSLASSDVQQRSRAAQFISMLLPANTTWETSKTKK